MIILKDIAERYRREQDSACDQGREYDTRIHQDTKEAPATTLSFTRQLFPEIKCIQQNSRISVRIHPASKFVQRSEEKNKQTKIQKHRGYLLPDNAPSERCRRVHLDSRDDGRNELEEDYQIKINPHSLNILLLPLGRRSSSKLVVFPTGLPSKRPLLLAVF